MHEQFTKKQETTIYDPDNFKDFCVSAGATRIFDTILKRLSTTKHSKRRLELNKKRTVTIIYKLCYCQSQLCDSFQKDHALYLRNAHLNQEAIDTQHTIGNTCATMTITS